MFIPGFVFVDSLIQDIDGATPITLDALAERLAKLLAPVINKAVGHRLAAYSRRVEKRVASLEERIATLEGHTS